ncbi:MAG TPA: hypothetical protein VMT16_04465 [Thermoanaerobaculia bacterium]|nr:hypothetical protein [Thermoanaerobaculia bacterium]
MRAGSTQWQGILEAALAAWHDGPAAEELPPGLTPEDVARLADTDPPRRRDVLALARKKLASFPFEHVHPGWLADALPPDPLLRQWALSVLPPPVRDLVSPLARQQAQPAQSGIRVDATGPPRWFAGWWRGELQARLGYPHPFPWRVDSQRPLTTLWLCSEEDAVTVLRWFGLRPLAAGLVQLQSQEVVRWLYALPVELRQRVVALVKERELAEVEGWRERLRALEGGMPAEEIPLSLALEAVAAQTHARDTGDDAVRLAYRLPQPLGERLLAALDEGRADLAEPVGEPFDARLRHDLDYLLERRLVAPPAPFEEAF